LEFVCNLEFVICNFPLWSSVPPAVINTTADTGDPEEKMHRFFLLLHIEPVGELD
jgi:hypothetical protein